MKWIRKWFGKHIVIYEMVFDFGFVSCERCHELNLFGLPC